VLGEGGQRRENAVMNPYFIVHEEVTKIFLLHIKSSSMHEVPMQINLIYPTFAINITENRSIVN